MTIQRFKEQQDADAAVRLAEARVKQAKAARTEAMWKTFGTIIPATLIISIIAGAMWALPQYRVYTQELRGEAALARATQERQIVVQKALSEKEAAADIAEAIATVGEAYRKYPDYRRNMYIEAMAEALNNGQIKQMMYVPTEAGIPITEAGRFAND